MHELKQETHFLFQNLFGYFKNSMEISKRRHAKMAAYLLIFIVVLDGLFLGVNGNFDYKSALTKSIIFLEAQRSGKLPPNNRVPWRGDSALNDGQEAKVDLAGGYYDAGDNVKYGFPMAFTITTLSWGAIFYKSELQAAGELKNVHDAIRWGTDYFIKASSERNRLFVQVGDPVEDHKCWMRPENMKTPRTVLEINTNRPGTEIAAETAAALASSGIVFKSVDDEYSKKLIAKAKVLFEFARVYTGTFDGECPFYCSFSGYKDELMWAATWLYMATNQTMYIDFVKEEAVSPQVNEFSWDIKYTGAHVLLSQLHWEGQKGLEKFQREADSFVCNVLPESPDHKVPMTPGGLIHLRDGANTQYVTSTAFLFSVYSDLMAEHKHEVKCGDKNFTDTQVMEFAKKQMDYILGKNPLGRSYMVGFGTNPPKQPHHRGASVPKQPQTEGVPCGLTFGQWCKPDKPNINELTGAIVGGPDKNDQFKDMRTESVYTEPTTYTNSLAIGVLARLTKTHAEA